MIPADRWLKPPLFLLGLAPAVWLACALVTDNLGANPVEELTHQTGTTALILLLATLAVSPVRQLTGWNWLARQRRMMGLFVFFYALLHFSTWLLFDHSLDAGEMLKDIVKRPYITVGFSAFCLLLPLAATSTNALVRRLGPRRWKRLHSLIYIAGTLAILHFLWLVKADTREPLIYAGILVALLLARTPLLSPARARMARQGPRSGAGMSAPS